MYIGTSLGGCLRSLLSGEVSEDEVMFIVTRTHAPKFDDYLKLVTAYHVQGNPFSRNPEKYDIGDYPIEHLTDLATRLWNAGKIHQPRVLSGDSLGYRHPVGYGDGVWLEVMPKYMGENPTVKDAYDKYKMVRSLVDERI